MFGRHAVQGDITGNPLQPEGRHLEFKPTSGRLLIGLGDRNRCRPEFNTEVYQELDTDRNDKLIREYLPD